MSLARAVLLLAATTTALQIPFMTKDVKVTSSTAKKFDLLVVGAGSGGIGAATTAAKFGKSVAMIEKERFGGDCCWTGCVPSKALLAAAKAAHTARTASKFGVTTGAVEVDMKAVKERVQSVVQTIHDEDDAPAAQLKKGVTPIEGAAKFVNPTTLSITPSDGSAAYELVATQGIIVATGAKPRVPKIAGIESVPYLTYLEIFNIDVLPKKLTVVGGGPIGCELAQAFARLGSTVTLVANKLLPLDEPEAGEVLEAALVSEGVIRVKGKVESAAKEGATGHVLSVSGGQKVSGETLLMAVGREPVVNTLGLETIGVAIDEKTGGIKVDGKLRTNVKGVYAVGDCTGDKQFTHYAGFQGAYAGANALFGALFTGVLGAEVPACTFTSPEVARVGLTEAQAIAEYGAAKVGVQTRKLTASDRARCDGDDEYGFIKIVFKQGSSAILGATICSAAAGEMIAEIGLAMKNKVKLTAIGTTLHAYPSRSWDVNLAAADVYYASLISLVNKLKPVLKFIGVKV